MKCWDILKIKPTKEIDTIKDAYAKLVEIYHPEENPEIFILLQDAYREAIKYARSADAEIENIANVSHSKNSLTKINIDSVSVKEENKYLLIHNDIDFIDEKLIDDVIQKIDNTISNNALDELSRFYKTNAYQKLIGFEYFTIQFYDVIANYLDHFSKSQLQEILTSTLSKQLIEENHIIDFKIQINSLIDNGPAITIRREKTLEKELYLKAMYQNLEILEVLLSDHNPFYVNTIKSYFESDQYNRFKDDIYYIDKIMECSCIEYKKMINDLIYYNSNDEIKNYLNNYTLRDNTGLRWIFKTGAIILILMLLIITSFNYFILFFLILGPLAIVALLFGLYFTVKYIEYKFKPIDVSKLGLKSDAF